LIVHKASSLTGTISVPADKSISHRALMFGSLALGNSKIKNLLLGHDCLATLGLMRVLGVHIAYDNDEWLIHGQGRHSFLEPSSILDCKNSGTTIRLMAGLLSAMPFMSILDGSEQIKSRPMDRVIEPLSSMGAKIFGRQNNRLAPLVILPSKLKYASHTLMVKSAQVKSAIILAGLFADGAHIKGTNATRDHTENLLSFMGADITTKKDEVIVNPLMGDLKPISLTIPGDMSSAAFLLAAGVFKADKTLTIKNVSVNHTRIGFIDALKTMGADITIGPKTLVANEPVADIHINKSNLHGAIFAADDIVRMIDEIPVLALVATQAKGQTIIKDAQELRVKESNRISKTVESLLQLGAQIKETEDGMIITGPTTLRGCETSSFFDHRIALFMAIAGLISEGPITISHAEVTDDSFPGFMKVLLEIGADISEVV
jgi:3-phosphoshikimate 1-carboxyvinyltransferase